jgi:hypothetical protein
MIRAGATSAAILYSVLLIAAAAVSAQEPVADPRFVPPVAGTWDPIRSIGQPPRWKPYLGAGLGLDDPLQPGQAGPTGTAGVYRDLVNPVLAMLGVAGEVYIGQRGERLDPGARLQLVSPAFYVRAGVDWNQRLRRLDAAFGFTLPPTRGGWFRRGGLLRIDYLPARDHSFVAGMEVPLKQPLMGRTRPRSIAAPLPTAAAPLTARAGDIAAGAELLSAMRWITLLQTFAWRMGDGPLDHDGAVRHSRTALHAFASDIAARAPPVVGQSVYAGVLADYHAALDAAFADAVASAPGSTRDMSGLAGEARRIVLEEVLLPYNRLIGQYKSPDGLYGLAARARARFLALLLLRDLPPATVDATMRVFDGWLHNFEAVRVDLARETRDNRMHWLPLALVLPPEEHATQAQVDALVETALGRPFSGDNVTRYIDAMQFQQELTRTILATRDYHVLWIHDFRGRDVHGDPDHTGFLQTTDGYLRALLDRVRVYDAAGRLPVYIIMIDQHSYEEHDARIWLDLLERPLTHEVQIPGRGAAAERAAAMRQTVVALQDSLRHAVAASRRLSAEAAAFGDDWLEQSVRVHVNVTFPSDPSFRAPQVLRLPFAGDNLMRDHRKIVIRDITEAEPHRGEVIITGVGVGDHYANVKWDDRAIVISGPAALEAKHAARAVLEDHGLGDDAMPPPLRALLHLDGERSLGVAGRAAADATARALQVHNRTGFGDKDATFLQLLLYDLAPAGTVIYVPDSLWLSFERLGQLLNAALRGCHVILVAPALDNAPNTGFPQLSRMQELVTRAAVIQEQLGGAIRAGGGDFRVGLYTRQAPLDDVARVVAELEHTFERAPFLAALFPLSHEAWAALRAVRRDFENSAAPSAEPGVAGTRAGGRQPDDARPLLHRKTQLLASRDALAGLSAAPGLGAAFTAKLRGRAATAAFAAGIVSAITAADPAAADSGPSAAPSPDSAAAMLPGLYRAATTAPRREGHVLYLLAGTMNMDPRSALLDGEATVAVAGEWAAQAFMDFALLSGGITWIESVEQAAALLPPLSRIQRWLGRIVHPAL